MPASREDSGAAQRGAEESLASPHSPVADTVNTNSCTAATATEGDFVHPEAASLYSTLPFMRFIPLASESMSGYGPRPIFALGVCYFFNKGLSNQLMNSATFALLVVRFGIDGTRFQRLGSMGTLGWSLNAFTAMMCDTFALLGYTKRWYMFISCIVAGVLTLTAGLLPARQASANTAAAFIFLASFGRANVDILSEGYYTRKMRQRPAPGPALVSYIWCASMAGTIISSAINGPVSDKGKPQINFIVAGAVQIAVTLIFAVNWYREQTNRTEREEDAYVHFKEELALELEYARHNGEDPMDLAARPTGATGCHNSTRSGEGVIAHAPDVERDADYVENVESGSGGGPGQSEQERRRAEGFVFRNPPRRWCGGLIEYNSEVLRENWRIFVYSCIMTAAVIAMTVGTIFADTLGLLLILVIVSTVCCATSFWALPLVIAKANVFGYLTVMVDITVWGPMYAFYVATPQCSPDGPHFSFTFYSTIGPIVGNIAGIVGVNAFNYIFRTQRYRLVFILTTFINIFGNIFDIIIVKRWNLAIGIPDHAMYLFGNAVIYDVCYMIEWMPMIVLISRLCPRGSESMVFAIMSGFRSIGQTTAAQIGTVIIEYGWTVPACDFTNLPMILLVCRILCPLLVIPLVFLVPNARICDDLDIDGDIVRARMEEKEVMNGTDTSSTNETKEMPTKKKSV
ncbi:putative pteridine transporter [Novymonas esmeraldas]|uniref:Pteridine transporter n=1 Tax=Novymonas esmeraldas TaxID=1808958 RepID=A0AAW0F4T1_9TRYP